MALSAKTSKNVKACTCNACGACRPAGGLKRARVVKVSAASYHSNWRSTPTTTSTYQQQLLPRSSLLTFSMQILPRARTRHSLETVHWVLPILFCCRQWQQHLIGYYTGPKAAAAGNSPSAC